MLRNEAKLSLKPFYSLNFTNFITYLLNKKKTYIYSRPVNTITLHTKLSVILILTSFNQFAIYTRTV